MFQLYEHNRIAYESAMEMLQETGKAAVVHPTGTGKSFIGFKLCEDNPDKTVLWLSPSEYIFRTQIENLRATGAEVPGNIVYLTYAKLSSGCRPPNTSSGHSWRISGLQAGRFRATSFT